MEKSRASVVNYFQIIRLFCENNQIDKAMLIFQDMEKHGIPPSVPIYNAIIHGFARIKEFEESKALLTRMVEDDGLSPIPETYNGLIQAYGSHGFYDDMSKCVKMMESAGCSPNELTYNTLIQEFSRGRLLEKMEKFYRTLLSNRMNLQTSTLIAMLKAYSDLGILEKMERIYLKVLNSNGYIEKDLIRKVAKVYIENCRFARLEEFGYGISGRTGRTELVWCILLLSAAGLLSRRGMNSIAREMEISKVRLSTTFANIFALFYLKIKDFKALNGVFSEAVKHRAEPDMLTVCILFDARLVGYDCTNVLEKWRRYGYLEAGVEMRTDPLVMSAFGKGTSMLKCGKIYSSLGSEAKGKKLWKYSDLIRLVSCDLDDGEDG